MFWVVVEVVRVMDVLDGGGGGVRSHIATFYKKIINLLRLRQ